MYIYGLPRCLSGKGFAYQCRRHPFNPWVGKSPGGGNGNPLQYSYLGNPMDRRAWWAVIPWGHKELDVTKHTHTHTHTHTTDSLCCTAEINTTF